MRPVVIACEMIEQTSKVINLFVPSKKLKSYYNFPTKKELEIFLSNLRG